MVRKNKTLYLFTIEFPYGNKSETFLEEEIIFLANAFEKIIIIPTFKVEMKRELPPNVYINDCFIGASDSKVIKLKYLILNALTSIRVLNSERKSKGNKTFFKHFKFLIDYLSIQLRKKNILKKSNLVDNNAIYYDYWFLNSTLSLSILKQKKVINYFVSRGHGFDIYDHYHGSLGVPFRDWVFHQISKLFIVSNYGRNYFNEKVNFNQIEKISTSYLGISEPSFHANQNETNEKLIVSCSSIIKIKNVSKIPIVLNLCKQPVKWIHFGDGELLPELIESIKDINYKITIELKGHLPNNEVLEFYKKNKVDLFLSLSSTEGLPVSMMEAQSYGIPIMAFNIEGIPEIVKNEITGELLELNYSNKQIAERIDYHLSHPLESTKIIEHFEDNFTSVKNYPMFVELLHSLHETNQ